MHPQREELVAYLDGMLTEPDAQGVEGHLQTCPECEATLNLLGSHSDTMLEQLRQGPPADVADSESACQAMVEVIKDIGRNPQTLGMPAAATGLPELGYLREYQLLQKLGEGGMGAVYRALHTKLDKIVALKVLPGGRMQNSAAVARFEREMKAVGKLRHPNIVGAFDAGEAGGMQFLVMELVEGKSLSAIIKEHAPLAVADACELVRQTAVGLQEAHDNGMVHRDIKPSNLMLTVEKRKSSATGIVKILDLGLALLDASQASGGELTNTGQLMGTIHYMAPEQANDTHLVDIRADIYALGVVLFELLTGQIPLEAKRHEPAMSKLMALIEGPNRSIRELRSDLPAELIALVDRMLAKQPAARPATPEEVATALEPFAADHQIAALLDATAARAPRSVVAVSKSPAAIAATPAATLPAHRGGSRNFGRVAAGFAAAFFFVAFGVWLIVRDKQGNEVARVLVPDGGTAVVDSGSGVKKIETDPAAPPDAAQKQTADGVPPKSPAAIIGPSALRFELLNKEGSALRIPSLHLPVTGPLTVEGYIKLGDPNNFGRNAQFFGAHAQFGVNGTGMFWATAKPGALTLKQVERFSIDAGSWKKNTWEHVAAVRDGQEHRLYVDGVFRGSAPAPETLAKVNYGNAGEFFIGSVCHAVTIREVRVSSVARYSKTFLPAERFEPDADTLALYHLDEGSGDLVHDASGHGLDARLSSTGEKWVRVDAK